MSDMPVVERRAVACLSGQATQLFVERRSAHLARRTYAMVLAGGRGSRLKELTDWRCKPAVPFGGKYRIVDFTLSNCVNSGVRPAPTPRAIVDRHCRLQAGSDTSRFRRTEKGITLIAPEMLYQRVHLLR